MKYIKIPEELQFVQPTNKEPVKGMKMSFHTMLLKLLNNPVWNRTFENTSIALKIEKAYDSSENGVMVLDDAHWQMLKDCVDNPQEMYIGADGEPKVQIGWGLVPSMHRQLFPLLEAITKPFDEKPE